MLCAHASSGSPPSSLPASVRNASCVVWSSRIAIASSRSIGIADAFVELQLLLELSRPRRNERARLRRHFGFEVLDVRADRLRGFGLRVGQIAEQMQVVDARKRPRQLLVDELQRAAHRFDADLDEDAWRILDVVARRLNERAASAAASRAPGGPARRRRVREQRLPGEAGASVSA